MVSDTLLKMQKELREATNRKRRVMRLEKLIAIEADFHGNWIKNTAHVKPIAIDSDRSCSFDSRETKQTSIRYTI